MSLDLEKGSEGASKMTDLETSDEGNEGVVPGNDESTNIVEGNGNNSSSSLDKDQVMEEVIEEKANNTSTQITPKPKIGPKSKMNNGSNADALSGSDLNGSSNSENKYSSAAQDESNAKKYKPGPKSKQLIDQSMDGSSEVQGSVPLRKPMPKSKMIEVQPLGEGEMESNIQLKKPRLGPKSKTQAMNPNATPMSMASFINDVSSTSEVSTTKRKPGPKSKRDSASGLGSTPKRAKHSRSSESPEIITVDVTPNFDFSSSFFDTVHEPKSEQKRVKRKSVKQQEFFLPVDSNFPVLLENSSINCKYFGLPDMWKKEYSRRTGGASEGKWDAYLHPPPEYRSKKIRSLPDLLKFLNQHPECKIDPCFVNMDNTPSTLEGNIDGKLSSGGTRIKKFLEFRAAGGDLENFDQTPKKSKTVSSGTKSKPKSTKTFNINHVNNVSDEVTGELLRYASSEMPSKKEEADKLNKSEKFIVEENLPDFSDDENEARVEASVIFTPE